MWPGQFVAARIILRVEKDALVLPEGAVQPGQDRAFVYIVRDGKAAMQEVRVDRQIGNRMVIGKGLNGDEQVVVDVPLALTVGAQVVVRAPGEGKGKASEGKGSKGEKGEKSEKSEKSSDNSAPEPGKADQDGKAKAASAK